MWTWKQNVDAQIIGISGISVFLIQLPLLRQFKISLNKYLSRCSNRTFKKLQKDKILHQLRNQTEGLLFLLIFYTTYTVAGAVAKRKTQETLITNVWVHCIIYRTSYKSILTTLPTPIFKSTSEWPLPIVIFFICSFKTALSGAGNKTEKHFRINLK